MVRKKKPIVEVVEEPEESEDSPVIEEVAAEEPAPIDPRYTVLKDSIQKLINEGPQFPQVKDNPWLHLQFVEKLKQLVS